MKIKTLIRRKWSKNWKWQWMTNKWTFTSWPESQMKIRTKTNPISNSSLTMSVSKSIRSSTPRAPSFKIWSSISPKKKSKCPGLLRQLTKYARSFKAKTWASRSSWARLKLWKPWLITKTRCSNRSKAKFSRPIRSCMRRLRNWTPPWRWKPAETPCWELWCAASNRSSKKRWPRARQPFRCKSKRSSNFHRLSESVKTRCRLWALRSRRRSSRRLSKSSCWPRPKTNLAICSRRWD